MNANDFAEYSKLAKIAYSRGRLLRKIARQVVALQSNSTTVDKQAEREALLLVSASYDLQVLIEERMRIQEAKLQGAKAACPECGGLVTSGAQDHFDGCSHLIQEAKP